MNGMYGIGLICACVGACSAFGLDVRVRPHAGGPQIEVNGQVVPARMFWGRSGTAPRILKSGWQKFVLPLEVPADVPRANFHMRFEKKDGATLKLRNFVLTADGKPVWPELENAFADDAAFAKAWSIWPPTNDYKLTVTGGVLSVALHPWRLTGHDPDYHYYSKFRTLKKGVKYVLSFEACGEKGCSWITPACYAVSEDGLHTGVPFRDVAGNTLLASAAKAAAVGVNFVSYGIPEVWRESGYDFKNFDILTREIIAVNPKVLLIPRVNVNSPEWWCKKHPEHRIAYAKEQAHVKGQWSGRELRPNVATVSSRLYRKAANDYIAAFCRHMEEKFPENFAGIHPTGQNTHEWFYYDSWSKMSGWDTQTRDAFRAYLGDPLAEVPTFAERTAGAQNLLLDATAQARVIAFNRFQQIEMSDFVAELARTCRKETNGRKLVVMFYGYAWEFAGHTLGPANSGHYGVENLIAKSDGALDILCSPISYSDRLKCGSAGNMSAGETVMRQGILWLNEDDSRTYLTRNDKPVSQEGSQVNLQESCHVMLRNTAQEAIRGFGSWWMDLPGSGWYDSTELWAVQQALMPIEKRILNRSMPFTPEVALIQDEESMTQMAVDTVPVNGLLVSRPRATMNRTGVPHGQYLLFDVLQKPLSAKLQIFQSDWVLTDAQVNALIAQKKANPRVWRVWCYAPAWRNEKGFVDAARATALTGFRFSRRAGDTKRTGLFTVLTQPRDEVFARYPEGTPSGVIRRNAQGGADVFVGVPDLLSTPHLRKLAVDAGAHAYLAAEDVGKATLWATANLEGPGKGGVLSVQALEACSLHLITGRGTVRDALTGAIVGEGPNITLDNMKPTDVRVLCW